MLDKIHGLKDDGRSGRDHCGQGKMSGDKFPENQIPDKRPQRAVKNLLREILERHGKPGIHLVDNVINHCTEADDY